MKRTISCLLSLLCIISVLSSCGNDEAKEIEETTKEVEVTTEESGTPIPDVIDVDEASAKAVLSSQGLIPATEYYYNDDYAEGNVCNIKYNGTTVKPGTKVPETSKITLVISKGPKYIESTNATIEWSTSTTKEINFYTPYIDDGYLYIVIDNTIFETVVAWKDNNESGHGFGSASITDSFDKSVPLDIVTDTMNWNYGDSLEFILKIPVTDLDVQKPTTLSVCLVGLDAYGEQVNVYLDFTMSW